MPVDSYTPFAVFTQIWMVAAFVSVGDCVAAHMNSKLLLPQPWGNACHGFVSGPFGGGFVYDPFIGGMNPVDEHEAAGVKPDHEGALLQKFESLCATESK